MNYPQYALQELGKISERMEKEFLKVWTVLSPSVERDDIMFHLYSAKKKINDIIGGNENNG